MNRTRVAVIGVGNLGQHHARIYAQDPNCDLIGVVDTDPKNGEKVASRHGTRFFPDFRQLIGKIDAASVVVPTVQHHPVASMLLDAGIHCLVEKPITNTVKDAEDLIDRAQARGAILQVGHIERFNSAIMRLGEMVTNPAFIECHRLGPYDPRVKDVGVVLDLMIHDLDIILNLVKSPVVQVEGVGVGVYSDREDIANARLTFASGAIASLNASRVTPYKKRKIRVWQPNAYYTVDYVEQEIETWKRYRVPNPLPGQPQISIVRTKEKTEYKEPLKLEIEHFLDCIRRGASPLVRGEHGRDALELAVEISNQIRKRIQVFLANLMIPPGAPTPGSPIL
jgi:predicted dehydrogenase